MSNLANKKLLILGANPDTVGFIKRANELGVYTIVTDNVPNAIAKQYARKAYDVDAVDVDALYALAIEENIDGVMVGVAEPLLIPYAKLCEKLSMPCYGTEDIFHLMTDKERFKSVCRKYDVPVVPDFKVSYPLIQSEIEPLHYPVVVKPVDSYSSKGISICENAQELEKAIPYALSFSPSKRYLVEKYMVCGEVILYYIIQNGTAVLTAMCDRYTNKEQKGVAQLPVTYVYPSRFTKQYLDETDSLVKVMLKDIGVTNGGLMIQSFIDDDGHVLFNEPGFRLNGGQEYHIVSNVSGVDIRDYLINFALTGEMSDTNIASLANPKFHKLAARFSPLAREGRIASLEGIAEITKIPEVIAVNPCYNPGDEISGRGTLRQIVAHFFLVADTKERLVDCINQINDTLHVVDAQGKNMLLTPFDTELIATHY